MNKNGKIFAYIFWIAVGMAIGAYLTYTFICGGSQ